MRKISLLLLTLLFFTLGSTRAAWAHQPHFEEQEASVTSPWGIEDPTVSLALYFTLDSATDVDYFTFAGRSGDAIFLGMSIPQIAGQEAFAPAIAVIGPGLPKTQLPTTVQAPAGMGALILRAAPGKAPTFFEPFSRTRYWQRQQESITLPQDGQYLIAIWDEGGQVGRYTFAAGTRELFGGGVSNFSSRLVDYWTPVVAKPPPVPKSNATAHEQCDR